MTKSKELENKIFIIKEIIENVKKTHNLTKQEDIENYFWENHKNMMDTYPFLISHLASKKDNSMLDHMLQQLKLIEAGHSKDEIEKNLGEKLAEKYITPKIDTN